MVVELLGDGVEPDDALSCVEVDEAEPVVLLEASSFADPHGTVWVYGDAIAAKDEHASKASRGPIVRGGAKRGMVNAGGCDCNNLAVRRDVVEDGSPVVVGERGDGRGGGLGEWVGHGNIVQGSSSRKV